MFLLFPSNFSRKKSVQFNTCFWWWWLVVPIGEGCLRIPLKVPAYSAQLLDWAIGGEASMKLLCTLHIPVLTQRLTHQWQKQTIQKWLQTNTRISETLDRQWQYKREIGLSTFNTDQRQKHFISRNKLEIQKDIENGRHFEGSGGVVKTYVFFSRVCVSV